MLYIRRGTAIKLHDLILGQAAGVLGALHRLAVALVRVLDVVETKRSATVLVARELGDGGVSILVLLELDHAGSARATVGLVLDLSTLNLADRGEQLYKVFVAGRPRQVADVNRVAGLSAGGRKVCEWVGRV